MTREKSSGKDLRSLIDTLSSKDGSIRQKARRSLVALGQPAVSSLTCILHNSKLDHTRWEAAKTLSAIGDSRALPALVKALEDRDPDVAWVAADALRKSRKAAWKPLLRNLSTRGANSLLLRHGAHHVLHGQKEVGFNDLLTTLLKALKSSTAPESTPVAAYEILVRMKARP